MQHIKKIITDYSSKDSTLFIVRPYGTIVRPAPISLASVKIDEISHFLGRYAASFN